MADKDDRPGGMLEIPDSLGRDIDRAADGKIPPPPIEAFLSDAALGEIERATRARDEPVHAERLVPIGPGEAAARRTQHGQSLPSMPAARRVIPAPFSRPRIEAGSHGKTWQWAAPGQVEPGDIVPGVGRVASVAEQVVYADRSEVTGAGAGGPGGRVAVGTVWLITGIAGAVRAFRPSAEVRVFREAVSQGQET